MFYVTSSAHPLFWAQFWEGTFRRIRRRRPSHAQAPEHSCCHIHQTLLKNGVNLICMRWSVFWMALNDCRVLSRGRIIPLGKIHTHKSKLWAWIVLKGHSHFVTNVSKLSVCQNPNTTLWSHPLPATWCLVWNETHFSFRGSGRAIVATRLSPQTARKVMTDSCHKHRLVTEAMHLTPQRRDIITSLILPGFLPIR